jgi:hypothetical protein
MQMFNFVQHADCILVICDRPLIFSYCTKLHAVKLAKFLDYGHKRRPRTKRVYLCYHGLTERERKVSVHVVKPEGVSI